MNSAASKRQGFTLIELMLVVAIMAVAMTMSYPAISAMLHRAPLAQAVLDITEGCRDARRMAILQNAPAELRIFSDGHMDVVMAPEDVDPNDTAATAAVAGPTRPVIAAEEKPQPSASDSHSKQMDQSVGVELIDVNFVDYEGADVAAVKFYPNGTSDEFTIILKHEAERRKITLEVVTALAEVTAL